LPLILRAPILLILACAALAADAALVARASAQTVSDPRTAAALDEDATINALIVAIEAAVNANDASAWMALQSPNADEAAGREFFDTMVPSGVTRGVMRERDRQPLLGALPGDGYSLVLEVFTENGSRGRLATWRVDVRRPRDSAERQPWRITGQEKLSAVDGLHRLALDTQRQFTAQNLVVNSIDFELRLPAGDVFVAETLEGVTALVLLGDGSMVFTPAPQEERGQVRLFAGSETLDLPFTAAFIRLSPFDFERAVSQASLQPAAVTDQRAYRRAQEIFDEEVAKSFSLDLNEFSVDTWSLLPQFGDFVAEVRTRRFNTLTFARATNEAEDVSLFHRARKRNIAAYASAMKLSSRGRFYNEDDLTEYDVLDYDVDIAFAPEREWLDGRARLRLRVKAYALAALTVKLQEGFVVRSIRSKELGRMLFLRVRNQNAIVINLPAPVPRDYELTLEVEYAGRAQSQAIDQESIDVQGERRGGVDVDLPYVPPEPNWLLSNRAQWYPQGPVSDYATARMRFTVPAEYTVVASGVAQTSAPIVAAPAGTNQQERVTYSFAATQPLRYLAVVVSKFARVDEAAVALEIVPPARISESASAPPARANAPTSPLGARNTVHLAVEANKRQTNRGRETMATAAEILRFYAATIGDMPYGALTIAMVENNRPGGHSPGYFAVLNNPPPVMPFQFRNDPAMFMNFPEFYVAHELAHQWWGQAVGWKNYHEQWLSEGFAQYFAALYARERRGEESFRDVLRQFRRWAIDQSDQGAVYLGYRLGHIKGDSRVFRALVYNKGASVLHMLRRFVGDEAFFSGLKQYYAENRFKKAGTEDLQRAMEAASGRSLDRFFEQWIFASGIPRVRYSTSVDGQELVARFEQIGDAYDLPVTVSIEYGDKTVDELVMLTESVTETRIPLVGALRRVEINADHAALAIFERR
jgi:hypothetical protein